MKTKLKNFLNKISALTVALLLNLAFTPVQAAAITSLSDTMTRLKVSETSSHDISFTLNSTFTAGETITVDFDEDDTDSDGKYFVVAGAASVAADFDFNDGTERTIYNVGTSTDCTGSSGANDISVGINDTTGVVTFLACPSYSASGTAVNIEYGTAASGTNRVTNHSAAATLIIAIANGADNGKIAVAIITDDQIPVSASVNPSITLSVVNTALALGVLDSGLIRTSSYNNIQIGTNGSGGYTITVKGAGNGSGDGLYNSAASKLIASLTTTLSSGTEGYGAQCNDVSSDGTCSFATSGENVTEVGLNPTTFASYGSKPSGTEQFQIRVKSAISTSTDAGAYADTLTVIGTANF